MWKNYQCKLLYECCHLTTCSYFLECDKSLHGQLFSNDSLCIIYVFIFSLRIYRSEDSLKGKMHEAPFFLFILLQRGSCAHLKTGL